jgi:hypothetical protein
MNIAVRIIKENKDGSADAQVKFDKDGLETLVQWGLVAMLTKAVDEYKVRPEEDDEALIKRARAVAEEETIVAKKAIKKRVKIESK